MERRSHRTQQTSHTAPQPPKPAAAVAAAPPPPPSAPPRATSAPQAAATTAAPASAAPPPPAPAPAGSSSAPPPVAPTLVPASLQADAAAGPSPAAATTAAPVAPVAAAVSSAAAPPPRARSGSSNGPQSPLSNSSSSNPLAVAAAMSPVKGTGTHRNPYKCKYCGLPKKGHTCATLEGAVARETKQQLKAHSPPPASESPKRQRAITPPKPKNGGPPAEKSRGPNPQLQHAVSALSAGSASAMGSAGFFTNWFDMAISSLQILNSNLNSHAPKLSHWTRFAECCDMLAEQQEDLRELRESLGAELGLPYEQLQPPGGSAAAPGGPALGAPRPLFRRKRAHAEQDAATRHEAAAVLERLHSDSDLSQPGEVVEGVPSQPRAADITISQQSSIAAPAVKNEDLTDEEPPSRLARTGTSNQLFPTVAAVVADESPLLRRNSSFTYTLERGPSQPSLSQPALSQLGDLDLERPPPV